MSLFVLIKIIHITSAIFFIGCVYFRTLILPQIKPVVGKVTFEKVDTALVKPSRRFGSINNALLLLSGGYLYYHYFEANNIFLHVKIILGLAVITFFYSAPLFVPKLAQKYPLIKLKIHHALLAFMLLIVLLSQVMFF